MDYVLLTAYFGLLTILSVYGLHRLWLVLLHLRHRDRRPVASYPSEDRPSVTIQLPIFNERYVAERLIRSVARIRYPVGRLEIQVLDDSNDDTSSRVAALVDELSAQGTDIKHIRRLDRVGFKAGALEYGKKQANGELLAVFDADFVPKPGFLEDVVDHFGDPAVGMVQVRWDHINRDYSSLTRAQAVLLDGHFVVEHNARFQSGRFFNFNGTAGVWRKQAIDDAGGWSHDTLTEDLDLSYRAQQAGWRFVFLSDVSVPAELPVDITAFKTQQHRWAKGSIQTAKKLLGGLLRSDLPRSVKIEAFLHLTANTTFLLMFVLSVLMPLTLFVRVDRGWWGTFGMDLPLFLFGTLSVCQFYWVSQREIGSSFWQQLKAIPLVLALGVGMSLNNARAVLEALVGRQSEFVRTPKYDIQERNQRWHHKRYVSFRWLQPTLELAVGLWFTPAVVMAIVTGGRALLMLPFLVLFQFGFLYVGFFSLAQALRGARRRATAAH